MTYDVTEFSVSIKQIPKIEDQNNISINVFKYENKIVFLYPFLGRCLKQLLIFY